MKTEKNILIAFILNIAFSIFEFIGGTLTNSVAIVSDSIHDMGDALSIGVSYFLEKKSKKKPDNKYTFGYVRYSILGALSTTMILFIGSIIVIYSSIVRIINPVVINYNGMIIFAIFGVIVNFLAAYFTKNGDSLNQKSVNLHMLEDVFGWVVVLMGSIIMKFTNINILDSIMSIGVAIFILISALKNLISILDLFLEKTPSDISISNIENNILNIKGVIGVHHIHIWSIDGYNNYATLHIITNKKSKKIKELVREVLEKNNINHVTIELERISEECPYKDCKLKKCIHSHH